MDLKPNQKILWEIKKDGMVTVRSKPNPLDLFGSMKSNVKYPGLKQEKEGMVQAIAEEAAREGLD